jgi:uncharacterized membrane protein
MPGTSNQRGSWFGIASCAVAVAMIVLVVETTTYHIEGEYAAEHSSVGGGLVSNLDEWVWLLGSGLVAGIALAVVGLRRPGERRWVAWTGLAVNVLLAALVVLFAALAFSQGASR